MLAFSFLSIRSVLLFSRSENKTILILCISIALIQPQRSWRRHR
jgi:hypothetical protein